MKKWYGVFAGFLLLFSLPMKAQITISGTVYDISKKNLVEGVRVVNSNGTMVTTDSMGRYSIAANKHDTLSFFYKGKPTQPFPVAAISNPLQFDISLHTSVESKYKVLTEVRVFSRNYKQDSIENRETYKSVFNYQRPGIQTNISPTGVAGADLDELINIFRFKRNRQLKSFQQRLENQEQEKYIDYRFSKNFVSRVTGLVSPQLDTFLILYRPSYVFTHQSSEVVFNQYILNCFYEFREQQLRIKN